MPIVAVVVAVVEFEWHGTCRVEFELAFGTLGAPVDVLATSVGLFEWVSRQSPVSASTHAIVRQSSSVAIVHW